MQRHFPQNLPLSEPNVAERVGRLCLALPFRAFMRLQCACEMSERHKTPTVSSPTHQTPEAGGSHWTPADLNQHQRHRKTPDIMPPLWTHAIIM